MSARLRPVVGLTLVALFAIAAATAGCNAILGLGDYVVGSTFDAGTDATALVDATAPFDATSDDEVDATTGLPSDGSIAQDGAAILDAAVVSDAPNCDADPLTFTSPTQCYGCLPTTSPQYANACTNSACVPFDDTRLTNLLQDGALPAVPPKDAASE